MTVAAPISDSLPYSIVVYNEGEDWLTWASFAGRIYAIDYAKRLARSWKYVTILFEGNTVASWAERKRVI